MAEELRDNLKALEPGLLKLHLTSLSWDEAKSWPCSEETHSRFPSGDICAAQHHTQVLPQLPDTRGLLWPLSLSSGFIQLLAAEPDPALSM